MEGQQYEQWKELCEEIAREKDPKRLVELVSELNCLLAEKEERLKKARSRGTAT